MTNAPSATLRPIFGLTLEPAALMRYALAIKNNIIHIRIPVNIQGIALKTSAIQGSLTPQLRPVCELSLQ